MLVAACALCAVVGGWSGRTHVLARRPELVRRAVAAGYPASDPVLSGQWYLAAVDAFGFWPVPAPSFEPVRVAVLDSGIDGSHPLFEGRVVGARSFVGGSPLVDEIGHGTMVAGEILAVAGERPDGQQTAAPVELLIGKVVGEDGTIDVGVEARAIRWAADQGARVINLSFGAPRDPSDRALDEYSPAEDAAVQYAYRKGALVVAPTGNCTDGCPYGFASYPAALSHVLAVSALAQDGTTPVFSNRDARRNDLAAPGVGIVSTFPVNLSMPGCSQAGYSLCASDPDYRKGDGTSFAAPLAAAAAALIDALRPTPTPGQVATILEHAADPVLGRGHNPQTGYGRLDIANALQALEKPLPMPNSPAGVIASTGVLRLTNQRNVIGATLDYYDDPLDVYAIRIHRGQLLTARITGEMAAGLTLILLAPPASNVQALSRRQQATDLATAAEPPTPALHYRVHTTGWYYLQVRATDGNSGAYRLLIRRS